MAYDGWLEYNDVVLVNVSRTVALARAMGVDTVRVRPESVDWIAGVAPGDTDYADIATAPWYDPDYPATSEFAGYIPLSMTGLDDSTLESTTVEYITDGGHAGKSRNSTLQVVGNFAIIAKTERGAEFGKRWLDRVLRSAGESRTFCTGADLRYSRWLGADAPVVHRRDVRLTRGTSITSKRRGSCSATWLVTFTLTAADPYEYGEPEPMIGRMGGPGPTVGPQMTDSGMVDLVETPCAQFDYTPIYDPLHPALVAPPVAPDFLPDGWDIEPGDPFTRYWARINPVEPSSLNAVPVISLYTTSGLGSPTGPVTGGTGSGGPGTPAGFGLGGFGLGEFGFGELLGGGGGGGSNDDGGDGGAARMIRVSIWPAASEVDDQCDPLFSAVVTYLPANLPMYVDGEQKATYVWDGYSPVVRRADSLVYSDDANPLQWAAFNDPDGLLVTLDTFDTVNGGNVRAALALVPKSD